MGLEIVYGDARNPEVCRQLAKHLDDSGVSGTIYLGYPVLASSDERVEIDALLVSQEHGLVAFLVALAVPVIDDDWAPLVESQDRLYAVLESSLGRHDGLRKGRKLNLEIQTATVFPAPVEPPQAAAEGTYCSLDDVGRQVREFPALDAATYRSLRAALERVSTIKPPKKRQTVRLADSRGATLKQIEKEIANLDQWQKRAAIEMPNGPQRIRGLAGSGKTVVLALKAAYLHDKHPDWRIAVTFQSRALHQQIDDLVTRFTFEHSNDAPDKERLQIMHAWGSNIRLGVYAAIAKSMGVFPADWTAAKDRYGMDDAFRGVCEELLKIASEGDHEPIFDAVLIDEAQDLPIEFFKLVYRFTKNPKRIVWAFDELQNLSDAAMPPTSELFGTDENGTPLVTLDEAAGEARRDIILPICYRNSPWSLATAHAVGFGIYSSQGLVQYFDDSQLWLDIGYRVVGGDLEPGQRVELERAVTSFPAYFPTLLAADDAVTMNSFIDEAAQDYWLADQIRINLDHDELEPDDILIVIPNTYTAKRRSVRLTQRLAEQNIESHVAGVNTSADRLFVADSVAIAHIHRAKGNEAPMVYVLDAQFATQGHRNVVSRRNTLFTAITRSRAWVRVAAWGSDAEAVAQEVRTVKDRAFRLQFEIPTADELSHMRRIHKDRSAAEMAAARRAARKAQELAEDFARGAIDVGDLSLAVRRQLLEQLSEEDA